MTRTFLVAVDVDASDDLESLGFDIEDAIEAHGIPVESVKPWSEHGGATQLPITLPPTQPPSLT
jgi:hypothetical protein